MVAAAVTGMVVTETVMVDVTVEVTVMVAVTVLLTALELLLFFFGNRLLGISCGLV